MGTEYELKTGEVNPDVASAQINLYKEIFYNAPCAICGVRMKGKKHGLICGDCVTKNTIKNIDEPYIDIEKIIREELERRQNEKSSN